MTGVRRVVRLLLLPALLVAANAAPLPALGSCVQMGVAERAVLADVVVYGTVTETRLTFAPASGVIRFRAERFLKSVLSGEIEVYLGPTKGGAITSVDYTAVQRGEAHTLYLRSAGSGSWPTDGCSGSHAGVPTAEEAAFFGGGSAAPAATPSDNTPLMLGGFALAAIVLVGALVARRATQGRRR